MNDFLFIEAYHKRFMAQTVNYFHEKSPKFISPTKVSVTLNGPNSFLLLLGAIFAFEICYSSSLEAATGRKLCDVLA